MRQPASRPLRALSTAHRPLPAEPSRHSPRRVPPHQRAAGDLCDVVPPHTSQEYLQIGERDHHPFILFPRPHFHVESHELIVFLQIRPNEIANIRLQMVIDFSTTWCGRCRFIEPALRWPPASVTPSPMSTSSGYVYLSDLLPF